MSLEKQIFRLKTIRKKNILIGLQCSSLFIVMALIFGMFAVTFYKIEHQSYYGTYQTAYLEYFPSRKGYTTDTVIRMNDGMEFICNHLSMNHDDFEKEVKAGSKVSIRYHSWFNGYMVDELVIEDKEYINLEESMNLISSNVITLTVITLVCICLTICICTLICIFAYRVEIKDCKKLIKHYKEKAHKMKK